MEQLKHKSSIYNEEHINRLKGEVSVLKEEKNKLENEKKYIEKANKKY